MIVAASKPFQEIKQMLSGFKGVGVQYMAERFPKIRIFPGVNTTFMGGPTEQGIFWERCAGCGNCILATTGGLCPVSRCAKRLMNGPCGGDRKSVVWGKRE